MKFNWKLEYIKYVTNMSLNPKLLRSEHASVL